MRQTAEIRRSVPHAKTLRKPRGFFSEDIFYPDEDGKPMAESDFQRKPLTYCVDALDTHFEADPDVYVSGDLLIYYEPYRPGVPAKSVAPDVFAVLGIPKYERRSYKIWEEGKSPDMVVEIASESTWKKDIRNKKLYRRLGVGEYFIYDPTGDCLDPVLQGFRLDRAGRYRQMRPGKLAGGNWKLDSRALGMELRIESGRLRLYDPRKKEYLFTHSEERAGRLSAEETAKQEKAARLAAEEAAKQEKRRAEEQIRKTAETLLLSGLLTPEQIAAATGLSEERIAAIRSSAEKSD
jgi:Uma2 family endonuclease